MTMIVNTAWLMEYFDAPCPHEELVEAFPRLGLETERAYDLRHVLADVRIGLVRDIQPIAGAPGMHACTIEVERGRTIPVVCASEHPIEAGWGVPVAPAGTTLPLDRRVKAESYHGCRSEGMICLDAELGLLPRGSGLHHFEDATLLGEPLSAVLDVQEHLVELNVLPNRPDFLGLIGIAREAAAALGRQLRLPQGLALGSGQPAVPVAIDEPKLCSRYIGALLRGVTVGPSPDWFRFRLKLAGIDPINNVVDVTNYVMYECGQPLHAFDYDTLRDGRIVVRRMRRGESLELLTKVTLVADGAPGQAPLDPLPLVIADGQRPVALAGGMGGAATRITEQTANVMLEAAHFEAVNIRRTVNQVPLGVEGRGTESSYRYERGTDPNAMLELAAKRALQLLVEVAGGKLAGAANDIHPTKRAPGEVRLRPARAASYLGVPVDAKLIRERLAPLGMTCTGDDAETVVSVPTWRVDVNDPVVLIEDLARMIGYDQTPATPTAAPPTVGASSALDRLRQRLAEHLAAAGFFECRHPSLESPQATAWLGDPAPGITVSNPATAEMSVLRRTLLTGLATTIGNNLRRGAQHARFFEIDRTFAAAGAAEEPMPPGVWRLGLMAGGPVRRGDWRGTEALDFFHLKGMVLDLLDAAGAAGANVRPSQRSPYSPGAAAEIVVDGQTVGTLGEVDAAKLAIDRLSFKLLAAEIDL
ncbi:MAG TPA: phenylalanine--tRNA ligase subunit beta, partial [Lacipirellulaceae bacterium]|nr:phenylalanine--tRNA ligase subunit beta [Lacipirellulaceae bacterium]